MIDVPFVEISTFKLIENRINLARRTRENVAITGAAGVGKSMALQQYVDRFEFGSAHLFTVSAVLGKTAGTLFGMIAERIGAPTGSNPAAMLNGLKRRMYDIFYDDSDPAVLIFDEAQNLKLETLRDLLSLTDSPDMRLTIVFSGNGQVLRVVNTAKNGFEQIGRRVQFRLSIDGVTHEDTDLIADAFEVRDNAGRRLLRAVGEAAHVAGVVTILKLARELAGGEPIGIDHLQSATELFPQYRPAIAKR
jgi:type II secretory pathway predicted ATPase ExeA